MTRNRPLIFLALWVVLSVQPRAQILVIRGGTLFDGTGADPLPNATVVIEGNRIQEVGQNLTVSSEVDRTIDATGKTILPGLIDPHIHFRGWMPQFFLLFGVTSVFDTANPTDWILAQKQAIAKGQVPGPRMFVTGLVIDGPKKEGAPPHPTELGGYRIHVETAAEAREWVRRLHHKGVDGIKVHDGLTLEQLRAVVDEAGL
ncbi:hypothetical protein MYX82_08540 [Acidobacteria bacterium AH-259-D05]|nr:hypothetical protein [Acidobacteria bacterium AH-259-D05]